MSQLPRDAVRFARNHHGLVTLRTLTASGLSVSTRRRLLTAGQLVPVHQGVYRLASHPPTFEQRCLAACLALPDVVVSGPSAGRLYGLRKCSTDDVHVISRRANVLAGIHAHRTNFLSAEHINTKAPIRVLRPARLVCDLAVYLSDADLESVIEQVLDRRLTTVSALRRIGGQFMRSGRNGTRRLATVLNARPDWRPPHESDLELRVRRALAARGIDLIPQFEVELDGGRKVRLDLAEPSIRVGIEIDHATWHGDRLQMQRDKQRDRALMRLGWTIPRVTDEDLTQRFSSTIDELAALVDQLRLPASS